MPCKSPRDSSSFVSARTKSQSDGSFTDKTCESGISGDACRSLLNRVGQMPAELSLVLDRRRHLCSIDMKSDRWTK